MFVPPDILTLEFSKYVEYSFGQVDTATLETVHEHGLDHSLALSIALELTLAQVDNVPEDQ